MITITKKTLTLFLYISIYHISLFSFNPRKLIGDLWQKTEQEYIHKDYPLEDKSTIELNALEGKIIVKSWNQNKIIVEAEKEGTQEQLKNTTIGIKMRKVNEETAGTGEGNQALTQPKTSYVTVTTRVVPEQKPATVNYTLMVPEHSSLIIRIAQKHKGSVKIKHVHGAIDISTPEGTIEVTDSVKIVTAKTGKGSIKVKQKKFDASGSIFLENGQGNIVVYVPRGTNGTVHACTLAGVVTCEHPFTRQPKPEKLNKESWERSKREADGTLGSGGAPITLEATKGNISIEEY